METCSTHVDVQGDPAAVDRPAGATGTDPDDVVAVTVDDRGLPTRVELIPGWAHVISATALGDAVMSAYRTATSAVAPATLAGFDAVVDAVARGSRTGPSGLMRLLFDRGRVDGMEVVDRRGARLVDPHRLEAEAMELLLSAAHPPWVGASPSAG